MRDIKRTIRWIRREKFIALSLLPVIVLISVISSVSGNDIFRLSMNIILGIDFIYIATRFMNTPPVKTMRVACFLICLFSAIQIVCDLLLLIAELFCPLSSFVK